MNNVYTFLQGARLKLEGGKDEKNHIYRCLNMLLSHELQICINRTGSHGKMKFEESLEKMITCKLLL